MPRLVLFAVALAVWLVPIGGAIAHGDLERSDPAAGRHVRKPPATIELDFAEPPTAESRFEVTDGCREDVVASVGGEGPHAVLNIEGGAPGRWKVEYRTVSSVDGHLVTGSFSFHVGNKRPCEEPEPEPTETVDIETGAPPVDPPAGEGIPVVPIAVASAVVLGGALAIRLLSTR